jgi:hypothetical protein
VPEHLKDWAEVGRIQDRPKSHAVNWIIHSHTKHIRKSPAASITSDSTASCCSHHTKKRPSNQKCARLPAPTNRYQHL